MTILSKANQTQIRIGDAQFIQKLIDMEMTGIDAALLK
jgi:hypothetical protein